MPTHEDILAVVLEHIVRANAWLKGFGIAGLPDSSVFESAAKSITIALETKDGCQCYISRAIEKAIKNEDPAFAEHPDSNAETCHARCLKQHSLSAWDPGTCDWQTFVARAVKGAFLKSEEFKKSMYYDFLYVNKGLKFLRQWFWECSFCSNTETHFKIVCEESESNGSFNPKMHLGCQTKDNRFHILGPDGGTHEHWRFFRCRKCKNIYAATLDESEAGKLRPEFCPEENSCPLDNCGWLPATATRPLTLSRFAGYSHVEPKKDESDDGASFVLLDSLDVEYDPTDFEVKKVVDILEEKIAKARRPADQVLDVIVIARRYFRRQSPQAIATRLHLPIKEIDQVIERFYRELRAMP